LTGDELALKLFEGALQSIIDHYQIWDYEGENGSRACTHRDYPDPHYHSVHVNQLSYYAEFFGIDEFYQILDEFAN